MVSKIYMTSSQSCMRNNKIRYIQNQPQDLGNWNSGKSLLRQFVVQANELGGMAFRGFPLEKMAIRRSKFG